jgi:hypothetical protein
MEAVTHHALSKEKKGDCQDDKKQELSNSEPERLLSFRGFLIRILCHLSYSSAASSHCRNNAIRAPGPTQ